MPINLPAKAKAKATATVDFFVLLAILVGASCFVLEVIDPAPMDTLASELAAP